MNSAAVRQAGRHAKHRHWLDRKACMLASDKRWLAVHVWQRSLRQVQICAIQSKMTWLARLYTAAMQCGRHAEHRH